MTLPTALEGALATYAARDRILVASDFDGVLAPLVDDPAAARPLPGAVDSLHALARMPHTTVALVSGRALDSLRSVASVDPSAGVLLYGSHGAESTVAGVGVSLTPEQSATVAAVDAALGAVMDAHPGTRVERKPMGRAFHTRGLAPGPAAAASRAAEAAVAAYGVELLPGKDVVEVLVAHATKGAALATLAEDVAAEAILYLGDDRTDETVFALLGPSDVGVKVGPGETVARHRVDAPDDVLALLKALVALRTRGRQTHSSSPDATLTGRSAGPAPPRSRRP